MKKIFMILCIPMLLLSCGNKVPNPTRPEPIAPQANEVTRPDIIFWGYAIGDGSAVIEMRASNADKIYYTTDGTDPIPEENGAWFRGVRIFYSSSYSASGISVTPGCTVKAVAYKNDKVSDVTSSIIPTEFELKGPFMSNYGTISGRPDYSVLSMRSNEPDAKLYYRRKGEEDWCLYNNRTTAYIVEHNRVVSGVPIPFDSTVEAYAFSERYNQKTSIKELKIQRP